MRLALALALGLAGLEAGLRVVLFADVFDGTALATRLRRPELYSHHLCPDYWVLKVRFARERQRPREHEALDPELGWRKKEIAAGTLAHTGEAGLAGRRPVLLFGDSFAQCVPRASACWEDLFERSEFASRYALLNYGVGGYGLDQVALLARGAVARFEDPIVVIGILVDDDLDRIYLPLRELPKPWFALDGQGELVLHPPEGHDAAAYARDHPPGIASYLGRALLFGSGWFDRRRALSWTSAADHEQEKRALAERLLLDLRDQLAARRIPFFFVLFHGRQGLESRGPYGWQEPFLYELFEREGLAFVSSKRWLRKHQREQGTAPDEFFFTQGRGLNHYDDLGIAVVFEALRQGLLGCYEPYAYLADG